MTNEIYRDSSIYYDPTNNLINYITWDNGYSTESSTIFDDGWFAYVLNGGLSGSEIRTDPYGNENWLWVRSGYTITSRLYIYINDSITIDPTKSYRSSVWLRKSIEGNSESRIYIRNVGKPILDWYRVEDDVATPTSYILSDQTSNDKITSDWRLFVSYTRPYDWSGTTNDGGIYSTDGTKLFDLYDWKFNSGTTGMIYRYDYPYNSDLESETAYPRLDLVDGTEPSFNTILYDGTIVSGGKVLLDSINYQVVYDNNL